MAYLFTAPGASLNMISGNLLSVMATKIVNATLDEYKVDTLNYTNNSGSYYDFIYDIKRVDPDQNHSEMATGKYISFRGDYAIDPLIVTQVKVPGTKLKLDLPVSGVITSIATYDYDTGTPNNPSDDRFTPKMSIAFMTLKVSTIEKAFEKAQKTFKSVKSPDDLPGAVDKIKGIFGSVYEGIFKGSDDIYGGAKNDILLGYKGNDRLYGDKKVDTLFGGSGSDILNGGAGSDKLYGGDFEKINKDGSFSYSTPKKDTQDWADYSNAAGRVVVEIGNDKGNREYKSGNNSTFSKGDLLYGIENLKGSTYDDVLSGTVKISKGTKKPVDVANTLAGGAGHDTLTGGGGKDIFRFDTYAVDANSDTITDFTAADNGEIVDKIQFSNFYFAALGSVPANAKVGSTHDLKDGVFVSGPEGTDTANALLFYNETNGKLFYDADGAGTFYTSTLIATLNIGDGHPDHLTTASFEIVV